MARFYTDFSDAELFEGGKALRHEHSASSNHRLLSWDAPDDAADVDAVALIAFEELSGSETFGIVVRGDTIDGDEHGVFCALRGNRAMYMRYYDDTTGGFGSSDLAVSGDDPEVGERWWVRFRVDGSSLKGKRWLHGRAEPSSWDIDITEGDAPTNVGWVGLYSLNSGGDRLCDYFAVDTDGGSAPLPGESVGSDQRATDFSGQTVDSAPSGWTERWGSSGSTWTAVDGTDDLPPLDWPLVWVGGAWGLVDDASAEGGAKLRDTGAAGGHQALRWLEVDDAGDAEIVARLRTTNDSSVSGPFQNRVCVRGAGSAGSEDGYYAELSGQSNVLRLRKLVGGTDSGLDTSDDNDVWEADAWHWVRLRADGDAIKAKVWDDGDPEPSSWDIEATDTDLTSGWVGVGAYHATGTRDFDVVGVGTDGDSAPTEETSDLIAAPDTAGVRVSAHTGTASVGAAVPVAEPDAAAVAVEAHTGAAHVPEPPTAEPDAATVTVSAHVAAAYVPPVAVPDPGYVHASARTGRASRAGDSITTQPDPAAVTVSAHTGDASGGVGLADMAGDMAFTIVGTARLEQDPQVSPVPDGVALRRIRRVAETMPDPTLNEGVPVG